MGGMQDTGERFLDTLLRRDFASLALQLHPRVQLRVLQPGGALLRIGAVPVVERCESWFGRWDGFTVLSRRTSLVAPRLSLAYHLTVSACGDRREVAHQLFVDVVDERITVLDLLDSGFLTASREV